MMIPVTTTPDTLCIIIRGSSHILLATTQALPTHQEVVDWLTAVTAPQYPFGTFENAPCLLAHVAADITPPSDNYQWQPVRRLHGQIADPLFWQLGLAVQTAHWHENHLFCGRCATATILTPHAEAERRCPACDLATYLNPAPAIIVAVTRGDQILLARSGRHATGFFSVLAGFVGPCESLEEAVAREVQEEVGLQVKDITYFGSQSWPFPNSLMVAFTAVYAGGEITIDHEEIVEAGWFTVAELPQTPGAASIASRLIDAFIARTETH